MRKLEAKPYDLEKRTLEFSKAVIRLCVELPKKVVNSNVINQLLRAACSVGANYREANEKLSKKDFIHRMKITRKECKEASYWLELLLEANQTYSKKIIEFIKESRELRNIFSAIIEKSS